MIVSGSKFDVVGTFGDKKYGLKFTVLFKIIIKNLLPNKSTYTILDLTNLHFILLL